MDDETIEELCRRISPQLVGALTLQCGDAQMAEDVAQEALARAWERWAEVSRYGNPAGWVYRVAFNLAMSGHRRRAAERRAQDRQGRPEQPAGEPEDRVALRDALRSLTPRQRAAVVLRYYGQLTVAETALAMECAEGTVKSLTSQGVQSLRDVFEMEEVEP